MKIDKKILFDVVDRIMTDMFFLFPDMDEDGEQITTGEPSEDCVKVSIHFNTDYYLYFELDIGLLEEMASNFLGRSIDSLTNDDLKSMAIETANIIGGNYLVEVDPNHSFSLCIPKIVETENDLSSAEWFITFVSEDNILRITPLQR